MSDTYPKINSPSLSDLVASSIEQMIIKNEILPGARIPNEYDLAVQLKVGRSTVREAIKTLVSRNVLTIVRGSGTFVSEWPGLIEDPFGFRFVSDKRRLAIDLCEIRSLIEPYLAACAARNATLVDVDLLQEVCDTLSSLIKKGSPEYSEKDIEFHSRIALCSGNLEASKLVPVIHQGISIYSCITKPELASKAPVTHQAVVDAIRARDPEAAKAAMQEHLHDNMQILLNIKDDD